MQALHTLLENTNENSQPENNIATRSIHERYKLLVTYLDELKQNKSKLSAEEHEQMVVQLTHKLGQAALTELFEHYDVDNDMIQVEQQIYRRKHQASKEYQTAFGGVQIKRNVYVNRKKDGDGKSICPMEMQAGFVNGYWTPTAAKNAAWCLAHLTPQEVETTLLQLGAMNPSRSSLDRLPKILHKHWEPHSIEHAKSLSEKELIPAKASTIAISLDGVMVGMKPEKTPKKQGKNNQCEWREASCGTVSFFDTHGERLSTIQYGRMPEHKKISLKKLLQQETEIILKQRPDLNVVHIADGAQDNWCFFDEEMPVGFQLTDFYHASQYLKQAFAAAYSGNENTARDKFRYYQSILRDEINGVDKVLRAIRYQRQKNKSNKEINSAVTYFTNNQHRMKYAEAKSKNYPIGSGIVEAACKTLVGNRLKRSGMSWHYDGGQAILTLRSLAKSQRFDRAWEMLAKSFKNSVKPLANVVAICVQ